MQSREAQMIKQLIQVKNEEFRYLSICKTTDFKFFIPMLFMKAATEFFKIDLSK